MKRLVYMKSLRTLGLGLLVMCCLLSGLLHTPARGQSKFSNVIITNGVTTSTLTPTVDGLVFSNQLILQNPSNPTNSVKLVIPASGGAMDFAFPTVGGTLLSAVGGTLAVGQGGTGQSLYAVGDLLYASTTTALSKLPAHVTVGHVLTNNGTGVAPTWQAAAGGGGSNARYYNPSTTINFSASFTITTATLAANTLIFLNDTDAGGVEQVTIQAGTTVGQIVVFMGTTPGAGGADFEDGVDARMAGDLDVGANDTLTLVWNGSDWIEAARANNN